MPIVSLDAAFVRTTACPDGRRKVDYYDSTITGFVLECRTSGSKTYALRYRDARGIQRQYKIGDTDSLSFDQARRKAEQVRSRVVLGENPAEDRTAKRAVPTIGECFREVYLPHLKATRRNFESDFSFWKIHLLPKFGDRHLDTLLQSDILEASSVMLANGYSKGMANKWIVQLRYFYNVAKRAKVPGAESNPAAGIKQHAVDGRERFLSPEETERLRVAVERSDNPQLKFIVALLLMLGCRKRELLDAHWEHFDLDRRIWNIPLSKSGKSRKVPLSEAAITVLGQVPRFGGCPYVLPNPQTLKPFTGIHYAWDTARKRAKLPDVRIHDLRHSYASNLLNAGQSLFVVSKALGHSSIRMSERYAHVANDALLAAADAAAGAIGKGWTGTGKEKAA